MRSMTIDLVVRWGIVSLIGGSQAPMHSSLLLDVRSSLPIARPTAPGRSKFAPKSLMSLPTPPVSDPTPPTSAPAPPVSVQTSPMFAPTSPMLVPTSPMSAPTSPMSVPTLPSSDLPSPMSDPTSGSSVVTSADARPLAASWGRLVGYGALRLGGVAVFLRVLSVFRFSPGLQHSMNAPRPGPWWCSVERARRPRGVVPMNSALNSPGGPAGRITPSHSHKLATGHPPVRGRMSPAHGPAGEAIREGGAS